MLTAPTEDEVVEPAAPAPAGRRRERIAVACVVIAYLGMGVLANLPSWTGGVTHTMQCGGCGDSGQEVWFLAWAGHALLHLQDPLRTNFINYPWGVDLADNTAMPLAGALATPVTQLFGPVAAFNVVFSLAFAGSAAAMFFVLRRYVRWIPAAFFGGLLYGFSPYMVGQGEGHIFLVLAPVPPVLFLLGDEILVRQSIRWWVAGLLLGLVLVVQLGWSAELLACMLAVAAIAVVILALARHRLVGSHFPYAAKAIVLGGVVLAPFGAFFAHVSRSGPEHISGAVHSVHELSGLSTDLAGLVVPTVNQHFTFGLAQTGTSFMFLLNGVVRSTDAAENGSYIGIPLLVLLLGGLIYFRRDALLRFVMAMAACSLVLSMGSRLKVWGHFTAVRLPFLVFTHLPFLDSEVAARYSLFMWLFVAIAAALILDRAHAGFSMRARHHRRPRRADWPVAVFAVLAVAAAVSLVPGWPYNIAHVFTPPALKQPSVVSDISGGTLLTYPMARNIHNLPMVWQAVDDFQYRIPAGEASVANAHVGPTETAFAACWQIPPTAKEPPLDLVAGSRVDFATWNVRAVVIPLTNSVDPMCAVRFVQAVLGRPPTYERDAAVWLNVAVR